MSARYINPAFQILQVFEQKRGGAGDNTVYTLLLLLLLFAAESPKQKQKHWTVLSEQVPSPLLVVRTAIHSRSTSSPDPQPRSYHRRVPSLDHPPPAEEEGEGHSLFGVNAILVSAAAGEGLR